jgi:hypothetical protein
MTPAWDEASHEAETPLAFFGREVGYGFDVAGHGVTSRRRLRDSFICSKPRSVAVSVP